MLNIRANDVPCPDRNQKWGQVQLNLVSSFCQKTGWLNRRNWLGAQDSEVMCQKKHENQIRTRKDSTLVAASSGEVPGRVLRFLAFPDPPLEVGIIDNTSTDANRDVRHNLHVATTPVVNKWTCPHFYFRVSLGKSRWRPIVMSAHFFLTRSSWKPRSRNPSSQA